MTCMHVDRSCISDHEGGGRRQHLGPPLGRTDACAHTRQIRRHSPSEPGRRFAQPPVPLPRTITARPAELATRNPACHPHRCAGGPQKKLRSPNATISRAARWTEAPPSSAPRGRAKLPPRNTPPRPQSMGVGPRISPPESAPDGAGPAALAARAGSQHALAPAVKRGRAGLTGMPPGGPPPVENWPPNWPPARDRWSGPRSKCPRQPLPCNGIGRDRVDLAAGI